MGEIGRIDVIFANPPLGCALQRASTRINPEVLVKSVAALSLALPFAVACAVACAVAPAADEHSKAPKPHIDRTLSTSAEAEVKVTPDQAVMLFTVSAHAPNAAKALAAVDGPTARLLVAAKARGVKAEHLQSAQVVVQPHYLYDKKGNATQDGVIGTRNISVLLTDLTKLDLVVQDVLSTAAKGATVALANMRFEDSKMTEHKALARVHAGEAARKKAQSLADTLGAKLGPPRTVSEGAEPMLRGYENWQNVSYNVEKDLSDGGVVTDTFAPGQVVVSAGVTVVFDLEA
jgi:uncharacterized protein YggE